jgi:flagellar FliJ protein
VAANMKSLIRLHEWNVDEKQRKVGELSRLQAELESQLKNLDEEHTREQAAAKADPTGAGLTYPAYYEVVSQRRDNLKDSILQMDVVINYARDELSEAYGELKKYETVEKARKERLDKELAQREQVMLDEIALNQFRRKKKARAG